MKSSLTIAALVAWVILPGSGTLYPQSQQSFTSAKKGNSGARFVTVVNNRVFAGINPSATDGVDGWDTAAPPPPPNNYLFAYFLLDPGSSMPNYSVDIKKDTSSLATTAKEWKLRAITDQTSTLVTLNLPFAASLPGGFKPVLYDLATGAYQNLRDNPNYSYTSPASEMVSSFRVLIGDSTKPTATVTYPTGGEQFLVGSLKTITWNSSDASGLLAQDVYYSVSGVWTHIASVGAAVHSALWTVPSGVSTARIVVVVMDSLMNVKRDSSGVINIGHTITATSGTNGTINPSGNVFVNDGSSQTFTISPNSGYQIDSVIVNGIYRGAISSYTFTNVRGDSTIRATFAVSNLNDLVAQWSMEEGSGTVLVDSSTYHNNGTLIGSPTWVTGVRGKALAFNGSTQYATSPANSSFDITNAITLAVWIRPEVYNTQDLVKKAINGSTDGYELTLAASNGNPPNRPFVRFNQFSNGDNLRLSARSVSTYPTNGTWMHLAATYDGTTIRLYINGVLDTTKGATFTIAKNSNPVSIGGQSDGQRKFQGQLDDARIYNRALSASEIHDLALRWFTITSTAGANGSISPSGSITVVQGTNPTFTLTPATGYHVDSVFADGVYAGSMSSYTFTNVQANHTISATFAITQYTISASAGVNGSISPSGSVVENWGSNQTFTFTPNAGYEVDSVIVDGVNEGSMPGYTFSGIIADHTIRVTFRIIQYTITVTAPSHGSITPAGPVQVNYGTDTTFSFTPNTGYHIDSVFVDGGFVGNVSPYQLKNVLASHTLSVKFAIDQLAISATAGSHGSISPSGTVWADYGSNQSFTFTPDAGYRVDSVIVDGVNQAPSAGYTFTGVVNGHTIRVTFRVSQYTVTATAGLNGTISPSGVVTVNSGDSVLFTISAAVNYHISDVVVDGNSVGAVGTFTFRDMEANHTIVASFAMTGYTITATAGPNGSISPSGPVAINSGSDTTFTFSPNTGYHIDSILVDGAYAGNTSPYHFTNVQGNHTIAVKFAINRYSITSSVTGGNGTITPLGVITVNYGQNQSYTITPNTGYHIDTIFVNGVNAGNSSPYVFTNVTANSTISVKFAINRYTITSSVIGGNGTITPLGTTGLTYGGSQSYTMTPNTGFHVDSIFVNGVYAGKTSPYVFTNVSANYTIGVKFAINTYTIIATIIGGNGTINPPGATTVTYGGSQTYTMIPSTGYHIDTIYVDGAYAGNTSPYIFLNDSADHVISVKFAIDAFLLTIGVNGNGSVSQLPNQPIYNYGTSVLLTAAPADYTWLFTGWTGSVTSSSNPIIIVMDSAMNVTANFVRDSSYLTWYRSFTMDSIVYDRDNFGKLERMVLLKPLYAEFTISIQNRFEGVTGIHLELGSCVDSIHFPISIVPAAAKVSTDGRYKRWDFFFTNPLHAGDSVFIHGFAKATNGQKIASYYWTHFGARVGGLAHDARVTNVLHMPMPNRINALVSAYQQGGFWRTKGLLVGYTCYDSAKAYGWLLMPNYREVLETLHDRTGIQNGTPRSFDYYRNNLRPLIKQQSHLEPSRYNNKLMGDLITLNVNIAASMMSITPRGFGELVYDDGTANPLNGLMVRQIDSLADSMMMARDCYARFRSRFCFDTAYGYVNIDTTIARINAAFEGKIDTISFITGLKFKGTRMLSAVPYLKKRPGGVIPDMIEPGRGMPSIAQDFELYQNYPNPFNPLTTIRFELPANAVVTLNVYNVLGQEVATLVRNELMLQGAQEVEFRAGSLASGVYFYRLTAENIIDAGGKSARFETVRKMLLLK